MHIETHETYTNTGTDTDPDTDFYIDMYMVTDIDMVTNTNSVSDLSEEEKYLIKASTYYIYDKY